jgi:hypothetical protein
MYNMSAPPSDSPTLGSLLARRDLGLRAAGELDAATLATRVHGVHSSDLADPTPFLAEGLVLLTTGTQFLGADEDSPDFDAYVARLRGRGITALGFGTEVVREGIPRGLDAACRAHGLPLFEVPYRTPFIVARDITTLDAYAGGRVTLSVGASDTGLTVTGRVWVTLTASATPSLAVAVTVRVKSSSLFSGGVILRPAS